VDIITICLQQFKNMPEVVKTLPNTERVHHPYSPSSLQSLEACPCYRGTGDSSHERTIAGTIGHGVVETRQDDNRLSDEDAVAAAECLDFYDQRKIIAWEKWKADTMLSSEPVSSKLIEHQEEYLPIDDCVFDDAVATTAGYVDRDFLTPDEEYCEMFDWKFGLWPVEDAENNLQGLAYGLGRFRKHPKLRLLRFWFKQPLLGHISHVDITPDMIAKIYLRIQVVVARARKARADNDYKMARPHSPTCNFCANIGECPAVAGFALKVARKFHPLEFPASIEFSAILDPRNTKLALSLAATLKVWSEGFKRVLTNRILRGDAELPAGYKIQENSGKRQVLDQAALRKAALVFITEDQWNSTLEPTFGAIEDLIMEGAARGDSRRRETRRQIFVSPRCCGGNRKNTKTNSRLKG
jgi:hypothetical protein